MKTRQFYLIHVIISVSSVLPGYQCVQDVLSDSFKEKEEALKPINSVSAL